MPRKNAVIPSGIAPALAGQVLDLIRDQGLVVGDRLTELGLCEALGVSRSPVRKALQYLESLGALASSPNRGFSVARPVDDLRLIEVPKRDESDEAVYMRLVESRLDGSLGDEVSESELMEREGLSRLQVQRVLNRMARENLIERKPGRGWIFRPILDSVKAHNESYRFRMIIEPAAILEPGFKVDAALFEKVRRQQHQLLDGGIEKWTAAERFRAGAELHEAIVACSGNSFLLDALRSVNQLRRVIEYHSQTGSAQDRNRLRRQCQEHLQLLDLLASGSREEAAAMLRRHLDVVRAIKTDGAARPASRSAAAADKRSGVAEHL